MKIITRLGVITLLVPVFTSCGKNLKLSNENLEKEPYIIEKPFITGKEIENHWLSYKLQEFSDIKVDDEQNKYQIDIVNDSYNVNEFAVHSENFVLSDELQKKIEKVINSRVKDFSFYVISIDKQISFGYNPDQKYSTASSIKAPYSLFCYKQIENGVSSLDTIKEYNNSFYSDGSGIMQYSDKTSYTIRELLYNTIYYSDNIGYGMLYDHFGVDGYNDMLESLGCNYLKLTPYSKWGFASPREMVLVWQEIYNYKDTEYGRIFFDDLLNAKYNFIKNSLPNKDIAHKSGYSIRGYNDHGIVFDTITPYIISIMLPYPDETDNHKEVLSKIVKLSDKVIEEYNIYLENNKAKELTK